MDEKDLIKALIELYNSNERDQQLRLQEIFDRVDARKGYRRVQFGDANNPAVGSWSNCWNREKRLAYRTFVDPMGRFITDMDPGEE